MTSDFNGFAVSCAESDDGEVSAISTASNPQFVWSNGATGSTIINLVAGIYTVTVTDELGCSTVDQVSISAPPAISWEASAEAPTCFADNDGLILIDTILGGTAPFEFSTNGSFFQTIGSYPAPITFLDAGNYNIIIQDVNDCSSEFEIVVPTPIENRVDLGPDEELILGDSTELSAILNFIADTIIWNSPTQSTCINCVEQVVRPFETSVYEILAIDENGCSSTDEITVFINKPRNVFIPNAFSPNADGQNDWFFINAGQEVEIVRTFLIFDRWGEVVFNGNQNGNGAMPNIPNLGWNGQLNGQPMNPGVFVYYIEIDFIDGETKSYQGDLTLMK